MLKKPERFGYSPVSRRPVFTWPGGKRLALYVSVNVEHFPWGQNSGPDLDRPTLCVERGEPGAQPVEGAHR